MIQSLPKTIGLDRNTMVLLDALRKQRNVSDYSGDLISDGVVRECIGQAQNLLASVNEWLASEHPELLA